MCQLLRQFVVSSNKVACDARLIAWSMPREAYRQFDLEWLIGNFSMEHMAHLPDTGLSSAATSAPAYYPGCRQLLT